MVFTGTGSLDVAFQYLSIYIFGSGTATSLYLVTLLFIGAMMFRINFVVGLVLLLPINIVLTAYGYLSPLVGGLHVMLLFVAFAVAFFRSKH